ncbi:diguanylate cyclase (GGDEF) domain-containing protein [Oribacterium sp. KHPX15]|uniref:EAL domain-containing protein n=1 Tax=Oribacterium sp. KHPX15 TaxID=1855342 RepID=UPI00089D3E0D|nr:EAL domain-containing protein [Oribacterium sp. KHPX15]SEA05532.1 diguanylate cyclase (GGDEF) domain-containing protein [Oribacterium sp. KHPX15]
MDDPANITDLSHIDKQFHSFNVPVELQFDPLTGLLSRRSFLKKAQNDIPGLIKRYGQAVVLTLDLKDMKGFNTSFGQEAGDLLLCSISNILKQHFGKEYCSRFGEDRFYVFTRAVGIDIELNGIIKQIQNINNGHTLPVRIGIYGIEDENISVDVACNRARMACDTLRNNYNSGFVWFDEKLADENTKKDYLVRNLDAAINNGWIRICLQPVMRTLTGELCGFEALSRWDDPTYGLLYPNDFIQLLELNRISYNLDFYVVKEVAKLLKERQENGLPVVPISVNLSRTDFVFNDPVTDISTLTEALGIRKSLINIEITETSLVSDNGIISRNIDRFHDEGFQVWMDDFGSGYSSLNVLKDYLFDEIKIDMGFFTNFNDKAKTIVSMIVEMSKKLGMHTLAEGVETEEQLSFLRSIGCEKIQGNLFGSAMPCDILMKELKKKGYRWESRSVSVMYDKAGLTNVIVDNPVALLLHDGKYFKGLYSNEEFNETLLTAGYKDIQSLEADMNHPESPKGRKCRDLAFKAKNNNEEEYMTFLANGNYYKLSFRILSSSDDLSVIFATMDSLVYEQERQFTSELDALARKIMFNYDRIHYVDLDEHKGTIISTNIPSETVGSTIETPETYYSDNVSRYIHPSEQDRWKRFVSPENIKNKLREYKNGNFSALFRMRQVNGSYEWTEFTVTSFRGDNAHKLLVSSKPAIINDPEVMWIIEGLLKNGATASDRHIEAENAWDILTNKSSYRIFWKDTELRYVGASKAFYDYYDLTPEKLIGRTDAELDFRIDSASGRNIDKKVINKGEAVIKALGKNVVDGVVHHVAVNKYPMYNKGKICGLIGFFVDTEEPDNGNEARRLDLEDPVTGLMNVKGLMIAMLDLDDIYKKTRENYAHISFSIREYSGIVEDYGDAAAQTLLKKTADILRSVFNTGFILSRTNGGQFSICRKTTSFNGMMDLVQKAEAEIHRIDMLNGFKCTIHADFGMARASECSSVQDLVNLSYTRMRKNRGQDYEA